MPRSNLGDRVEPTKAVAPSELSLLIAAKRLVVSVDAMRREDDWSRPTGLSSTLSQTDRPDKHETSVSFTTTKRELLAAPTQICPIATRVFIGATGFSLICRGGKVVSGKTSLDASARTLVFHEYLAHFGIRGTVFQIVRVEVVRRHDTKIAYT